jgi:multisubunit Na+/H+ antiporter MnhC subunit
MSRRGQRSSRLRHRPSRAVPSIIAGILLLAVGVALVWLTITRLINGAWPTLLQGPRDWLAALAWNDPVLWQIGITAIVAGVILLLCAIIPGGFNALTIDDSRSGAGAEATPVRERETVMTRRAVARLAKARCLQIDGVGSAAATATTRRVHLSVETSLHEPGDLRTRITEAVRARLEETGLSPVPQVTATVRSRD